MRWLRALGPLKWPSLGLVLVAPIVAYPFWLPEPRPLERCGTVRIEDQTFAVYAAAKSSSAELRLVPVKDEPGARTVLLPLDRGEFDAGGLRIAEPPHDLVQTLCGHRNDYLPPSRP